MAKIEIGEVFRILDANLTTGLDRAMRDGATVADLAAAALHVRLAGAMRRKLGCSTAKHDSMETERLASLSRRLMAIDSGDIIAAATAAAFISGKPVTFNDDEEG
jgi:hypothetical protein